jgi:hypothetical protein
MSPARFHSTHCFVSRWPWALCLTAGFALAFASSEGRSSSAAHPALGPTRAIVLVMLAHGANGLSN